MTRALTLAAVAAFIATAMVAGTIERNACEARYSAATCTHILR